VPPGTLLTVMTYNIRYANPGDLLNHWSFRKAAAYNVIRAQLPDVMGTQEVLHSQLQDLREALPGYGYVGVGREDGKTRGEYCALFYRTERFDLLEGATFWLSATPDKPGKGWDAACERVVSWAKLKEKAGGKIFFAFNTHFDHVGSVARRESATLLKEEIRKIAGNAPVIVTGDFNAVATDEPIRLLTGATDPDHLTDTREISPLIEGPRYSFHDFGKVAEAKGRLIDYIFVKNVSVVTRVQVLDRAVTGSYISDHYPVLAVIEL
jgi:endonuclease/exonuclease/phosphatase family metal-dependent hydrolase